MKNSTLRMAWIIEDKLKALYYDGLFASINKKDIVWNTYHATRKIRAAAGRISTVRSRQGVF